jgi:hypothetical protein
MAMTSHAYQPCNLRLVGFPPEKFGFSHSHMQMPSDRSIQRPRCMHEAWHRGLTRATMQPASPIHLLCKHTPHLSLHSCNLPPLCYKRECWGPRERGVLLFYSFLLLTREADSHFLLQPPVFMASTLQRLGTKLPLSPICNPYYKLAQITQQHKLNVRCYSPVAQTSMNPVYPMFAQPSEARHAIRKIICRWLQNPDSLTRQVGAFARHDVF